MRNTMTRSLGVLLLMTATTALALNNVSQSTDNEVMPMPASDISNPPVTSANQISKSVDDSDAIITHATNRESEYSQQINELNKRINILQLQEKQTTLEASIASAKSKSKADPFKMDSLPMPNLGQTSKTISTSADEITVKAIYGNDSDYQATLRYRGADSNVRTGMAIDNQWTVSAIYADKVVIKSGKKSKTLYTSMVPTASSSASLPSNTNMQSMMSGANPHGGAMGFNPHATMGMPGASPSTDFNRSSPQ